MRTLLAVLAASVSFLTSVQAQERPSAKSSVDLNTGRKGAELLTTPSPRRVPKLEPGPVIYGGILTDVARSENLRKTFSLRQPVQHQTESPNLYREPMTGTVRGFVLFAIRF